MNVNVKIVFRDFLKIDFLDLQYVVYDLDGSMVIFASRTYWKMLLFGYVMLEMWSNDCSLNKKKHKINPKN